MIIVQVKAMHYYALAKEAFSNHSYKLQEFPRFLNYFAFESSTDEFIASPQEEYSFINYMYYDNIVKTAQLLNILYNINLNAHEFHWDVRNLKFLFNFKYMITSIGNCYS